MKHENINGKALVCHKLPYIQQICHMNQKDKKRLKVLTKSDFSDIITLYEKWGNIR